MLDLKRIDWSLGRNKPQYQRSPLRQRNTIVWKKGKRFLFRTMTALSDFCKSYAFFFDPDKRLFGYFLVLTVLSFVSRYQLPQSYFTQKRNILNDYFVKLGLFWTYFFLLPFIFLTSMIRSGFNLWHTARQLSRMLITGVLWYLITRFIIRFDHLTGSCSLDGYVDHFTCVSSGGYWTSFEISGHCFLLVYCSLTIIEEISAFLHWERIGDRLELTSTENGANKSKQRVTLDQYRKYAPVVRFLFIGATGLTILWDFMFVITSLYYHTWMQKMVGLGFAGLSWYGTYGMWYRTQYSPGIPS